MQNRLRIIPNSSLRPSCPPAAKRRLIARHYICAALGFARVLPMHPLPLRSCQSVLFDGGNAAQRGACLIAARARNPARKPGRRRRLCLLPKSVSARHLPGMPPLRAVAGVSGGGHRVRQNAALWPTGREIQRMRRNLVNAWRVWPAKRANPPASDRSDFPLPPTRR